MQLLTIIAITATSTAIVLALPAHMLQNLRTSTPPEQLEYKTLYKQTNFEYLQCIQSIPPTEDSPENRVNLCGLPPKTF